MLLRKPVDFPTRMSPMSIAEKTKLAQYQKRLEQDFFNVVEGMLKILDSKDHYTSCHSYYVMQISVKLAKRFGFDDARVELVRGASLLHDIGKVGIPYGILNKRTKLTSDEFATIKGHPEIGSRMVGGFEQFAGAGGIIRHHHERFDGKGYPNRIGGREIPLEARLIAVADSYHAMTSHRSYKGSRDRTYVVEEFKRCRGTQFDPEVTDVLIEMVSTDDEFADCGGTTATLSEGRKVPTPSFQRLLSPSSGFAL